MRFYKNSELTSRYGVSDKAVRNWIQASKIHKNNLELYYQDGNAYIADSISNLRIIEQLVDRGRKYRNHRSYRSVYPSKSFYDTYSESEIYDIINRLEIDHDLPGHYKYFGEGANYWDKYLHMLLESGTGNLMTNTREAISLSYEYIYNLVKNYSHVNIVSICVGNSLAIKDILIRLHSDKGLSKVKLVDISLDMLNISENNIKKWLNDTVEVECYKRDLSHQRFDDTLMQDSYGTDAQKTINLILFVAGPIVNFHQPDQVLHTINGSMSKNDILVTTLKRDTSNTQNFFDFGTSDENSLISLHDAHLINQLNVKPEFYEVEQFYNRDLKMRALQVKLKIDLTINFQIGKYSKSLDFKKGDSIRLWKSWHHSDSDIRQRFDRTDFEILNMSQSLDQQLNLLIAKVKTQPAT